MGLSFSRLKWRQAKLHNQSKDCGQRQDDGLRESYINRLGISRSTSSLSDVSTQASLASFKTARKAAILTTKAGEAKVSRSKWQQACTNKTADATGCLLGYQNSFCLRLRSCSCQYEPEIATPTSPKFARVRASSCKHEAQIATPKTPRAGDPSRSKEPEDSCEDHGDKQLALRELKRQDDFRLSYLRKLSYAKVWVPAALRLPKHQTIMIWDWDDTLLCTRFLNQYVGTRIPEDVEAHLRLIEDASKRLLERSLQLGHTFIITNAMEWWVKESAARWIPGVLPILEKIRIISARSRYERTGQIPKNVGQWKIDTFQDLQKELDLPGVTNLICIGDSDYEMKATCIMGDEFAEASVKLLKLRENPSAEELAKELALIEDKLDGFVGAACNLTMSLKRSVR